MARRVRAGGVRSSRRGGLPGRLAATLAGIAVAAAACGGDGTGPGTTGAASGSGVTPFTVAQVASSPREDVPSALERIDDPALPEPLVPPEEVISGGPPPDGIPAIDEPKFLNAADVDFLAPTEPVLALEIGGDARAYPVQIMTWHELVNDTVGGIPVTVSFCPLCNSAVAYDRRVGDRVLDFGTSGMLYNSALVMYDRQTESLWSHFTATAIAGVLTGTRLDTIPMATVAWEDWLEANPDGLVLSRDTGHVRDYGRNPYVGYDDVGSFPFLFRGDVDSRLAPKDRVVGIRTGDGIAVRLEHLAAEGVVPLEVDGRPVVVWHLPGTASALDTGAISEGRDVGATGVFVAEVDGRTLTFHRDGDGFVDDETSSRWNVLGEAVDGPLAGTRLEPVEHVDTFWFAWSAFLPDTELIG